MVVTMVTEGYKGETTNDRIGAVRGSLPQIPVVGDCRKGLILRLISAQLDCDSAARGKLEFEGLSSAKEFGRYVASIIIIYYNTVMIESALLPFHRQGLR